MKIAIVGATGLVGTEMLKVLEESSLKVSEIIPVASARSVGKTVPFRGIDFTVVDMDGGIAAAPDVALFSAGGGTSKEHAPRFTEAGITVIDNSSAWRMDPNVPLVVPEVNIATTKGHKLIANPNCSTIQMVLALAPLHRLYGIKRLVISTYQSVSGTGKDAVDQLFRERRGEEGEMVYSEKIDLNCIPHCDVFMENDYTREEMKLVYETRKILNDDSIGITATAVRVPVIGGHSEAVNVEFERDFKIENVRNVISASPGLMVMDDPSTLSYPTPRHAHGKNETFVGRLRRDESQPNTLNMWIVSDNLRKGAATNAVQIAEAMFG